MSGAPHHRPPADIDWAGAAAGLTRSARTWRDVDAAALSWLQVPVGGRVADIGCGPGGTALLLADAVGPHGDVVAMDGEAELLATTDRAAAESGQSDLITTRWDLDDSAPAPADDFDLVWAAHMVHHLADQEAGVRRLAGVLAPGGRLALGEGGLPSACLPWDLGIGPPGLESRLRHAEEAWFTDMRAGIDGAVRCDVGWPMLLRRAGLTEVSSRSFLLDRPAPLPAGERADIADGLRERIDRAGERLTAQDQAAWAVLLDDTHPAALTRRADVYLLAAATVHVGRRARADTRPSSSDLTALAPPERLADWRLALTYEAASTNGVLSALPGSPAELAARCDLDESALRAVLGLLEGWDIVATDNDGRYVDGSAALAPPDDAILAQHGVWIRRWSVLLSKRLQHRTASSDEAPARPPIDVGLDLLATIARPTTSPVIDACLERLPHARRALDLGGGHGEYSLELARRGLRTTMQDLPQVIEVAESRGRLGSAGVDLFAGDFFTTLPPGPFDLVLCATVTNMFDEPRNRELYDRLRTILAPGGGLAIVSYLRGRDRVTASFALQMLVATEAGDAHGEDDYRRWLTEAGYGSMQVQDLDDPPLTVVLAQQ